MEGDKWGKRWGWGLGAGAGGGGGGGDLFHYTLINSHSGACGFQGDETSTDYS